MTRLVYDAKRGEVRTKQTPHPGNVSENTARTVNEELHSLVASLKKITRRLEAKPHDATLLALKARQEANLNAAIVAAREGRVWRHRSHLNHMNEGLAKARHEPIMHAKRDNAVHLIPGIRED